MEEGGREEVKSVPQVLFMMGEDCRTCLSVHRTNRRTARSLLAHLLQVKKQGTVGSREWRFEWPKVKEE